MPLNHERPGVYSDFEASSVSYARRGARAVGAVGACPKGTALTPVVITRYAQAVEAFGGEGQGLCELVRLALLGGAASVTAVPVAAAATVADYTAALEVLGQVENLPFVVCDADGADIHKAMRDMVKAALGARRERVAVLGMNTDTVIELAARAGLLQSERVVLLAGKALRQDGSVLPGPLAAASAAGVLAAQTDPALPLSGAELVGLYGLQSLYEDGDIDLLVRAGVSPLDYSAGSVSVLRGVTTRTMTNGAADPTFHELTTTLIADYVIPTLRSALQARFRRAKNTPQVRGAIRSQVVMELEACKTNEIITAYDNVTATQSPDNPTVCLVAFRFAVAHTLNQIYLSAHIEV